MKERFLPFVRSTFQKIIKFHHHQCPNQSSSVNTLRIRIDLQPLLRHLGVLEKVQGHPDEMAFDLVEFLPDFRRGHEGVVEVALFELVVFGDEGLVVGEGFDCFYKLH